VYQRLLDWNEGEQQLTLTAGENSKSNDQGVGRSNAIARG